jgi:hypothetical protein
MHTSTGAVGQPRRLPLRCVRVHVYVALHACMYVSTPTMHTSTGAVGQPRRLPLRCVRVHVYVGIPSLQRHTNLVIQYLSNA